MYFRKHYLTEAPANTPKSKELTGDSTRYARTADDKNATQRVIPGNILTQHQLNYLTTKKDDKDTSTPTEKLAELLENGEVTDFKDYPNWSNTFKDNFFRSLLEDGLTYKSNPFLSYTKLITKHKDSNDGIAKTENPKANIGFVLLRTLLKKKEAELNTANLPSGKTHAGWLINPKTFKGNTANDIEYKIKTLAFLSTKESSKYGEVSNKPFDKVLNANTKEEIQSIIGNWATGSPTEDSSSTNKKKKNSGKKMDKDDAQKATNKYTEMLPKSIVVNATDMRDAMKNTIQVGDTQVEAYGRALLSIIEPQTTNDRSQTNQ